MTVDFFLNPNCIVVCFKYTKSSRDSGSFADSYFSSLEHQILSINFSGVLPDFQKICPVFFCKIIFITSASLREFQLCKNIEGDFFSLRSLFKKLTQKQQLVSSEMDIKFQMSIMSEMGRKHQQRYDYMTAAKKI